DPSVATAQAIVEVDHSGLQAIYKRLAFGSNVSGNFLFATNFHRGVVEMFNSQFAQVGSFTDSNLPPFSSLLAYATSAANFSIAAVGRRTDATISKVADEQVVAAC